MEFLFIVLVSLSVSILIKSLVWNPSQTRLLPGPLHIPIISNLFWLRKSFSELEPILRNLRAKYGPILPICIGFRPVIFIADLTLTHQALVQNGAVFSDRPKIRGANKFINSNQHNISSAACGPLWRVLRRNLTYTQM